MSDPINPFVHLNGSGKKLLTESYDAANDALYEFILKWERVEFNARDYYVHGDPAAFERAALERHRLNQNISDVRDYLSRILISLDEQIHR